MEISPGLWYILLLLVGIVTGVIIAWMRQKRDKES